MTDAATASTATGSVPAITVPSRIGVPCRGPSRCIADEPVDDRDVRPGLAGQRREVPVHRLDRAEVAKLRPGQGVEGVALAPRPPPGVPRVLDPPHQPGQRVDGEVVLLQELDGEPPPARVPVAAPGVPVHHHPVVGVDARKHVLEAQRHDRGDVRLGQRERDPAGRAGDRPRDPRDERTAVDPGQLQRLPVGLVAVDVEEPDGPALGLACGTRTGRSRPWRRSPPRRR